MASGIKFRLAAFILAIGAMVGLIAWTAQSAWRRGGELREKLTAVQLQSFQIADHFQQSILELNNAVLRYGAYRDSAGWENFQVASTNLDHWIDEQKPNLSSTQERQILTLIDSAYDDYVRAAWRIQGKLGAEPVQPAHLADFAEFEAQSQHILNLGFKLADAHRESMNSFLTDSNKALSYLRALLVASLGLLMLAGGGLAVVVYGELIAPLRVKLVKNQELLARQEKLASLGMLAAGVAHEIRNPLTAIKAWLFIQQKHLQPGTPEQADAEVISKEVNRLERIVRDVLLFARPSEPRLEEVPAGEVLQQVRKLLGPQLEKANITLQVEDAPSASVRIDPQQMQQVFINLVQNAAESIGRNGQVTLRARTETAPLEEGFCDAVVLEVSDTGKGIAPEVEKRLFDPFFTTKEAGTGLGLSIAARIVQKHGGRLQYRTQVNRGTTFGIVLPRARGPRKLAERADLVTTSG